MDRAHRRPRARLGGSRGSASRSRSRSIARARPALGRGERRVPVTGEDRGARAARPRDSPRPRWRAGAARVSNAPSVATLAARVVAASATARIAMATRISISVKPRGRLVMGALHPSLSVTAPAASPSIAHGIAAHLERDAEGHAESVGQEHQALVGLERLAVHVEGRDAQGRIERALVRGVGAATCRCRAAATRAARPSSKASAIGRPPNHAASRDRLDRRAPASPDSRRASCALVGKEVHRGDDEDDAGDRDDHQDLDQGEASFPGSCPGASGPS